MSSGDGDWHEPWRGGVERRPQAVWWLVGGLVVLGLMVAVARMRSAAPNLPLLPEQQFNVLPTDQKEFFLLDGAMVDPDAVGSMAGEEVDWVSSNNRVVRVGTVRNTRVPVVVQIVGKAPKDSLLDWDHVVECGLALPSGELTVLDGRGLPVTRLKVPPGFYRVRVCVGGLDRARDDHYFLVLWPAPPGELRVLKGEGRAAGQEKPGSKLGKAVSNGDASAEASRNGVRNWKPNRTVERP